MKRADIICVNEKCNNLIQIVAFFIYFALKFVKKRQLC